MRYLFFTLLLLIPYCGLSQDSERISIAFEEQLSIGDDLDAPLEYTFAFPVYVVSDRAGNIYVADDGLAGIRVYDRSGEYLKTYGGRGRGPGELLNISAMSIDSTGDLMVVDGVNLKVVKYDLETEDVSEFPFRQRDILWPRQFADLGGQQILMLYKFPLTTSSGQNPNNLFHIYDSDFRARTESFGSYTSLGFSDPYARRSFERNEGSFWPISTRELIYAPRLYNGKLYRFTEQENGWVVSQQIRNDVFSEPAFGHLELDEDVDFANSTITENGRRIKGYINLMDAGVYTLRDGKIVQFIQRLEKGGNGVSPHWELHALLYDANGTFLANAKLLETKHPAWGMQAIRWKDEADRFYMMHYTDDYSSVRVFNLILN